MNLINKAQRACYQLGSYECIHFFLRKFKRPGGGKSCCGGSSDDVLPMCSLTNTPCPGVSQCLKLDITTKSKLIQNWSNDLRTNKTLDPTHLIK